MVTVSNQSTNRSTISGLQKMDFYCIQMFKKTIDHFTNRSTHPVEQFHGLHQPVNRLVRNWFTFLDVQFDVFLISKPYINIEVYFRIIKSKVSCSNSIFQKICNFGFENRVYEWMHVNDDILKCTNAFT